MLWSSSDEVEQASTTIEFCKKEGGVGLGLRRVHPLKTRPDYAIIIAAFAENATPIATRFHGGFVMDSV